MWILFSLMTITITPNNQPVKEWRQMATFQDKVSCEEAVKSFTFGDPTRHGYICMAASKDSK